MLLTHSAFQDKLTYYVHTPLESLILVALHHDSAWTKFIMKWLRFYCLFFCTPPASRTIASGMLEDMFLLSTFRILLLSCWQAIQITSTGSRNCTHCPPHAWKWFAGLAVTFTGVEVRLTVLWVPIHPFHAKGCESFCLCLVLLLSSLFRLQWPLFLMSGQQQCHAQLTYCLHDSANPIHTPLSSLSLSGTVQDSHWKTPNAFAWPFQQLDHAQLLVYCTLMLKS